MRDYRDAKSMANDLRGALAAKNLKITVAESLEIVARLFGVADWNTLAAHIKRSGLRVHQPEPHMGGQGQRFTKTAEAALHHALRFAHERFHPEVTLEHLLLALTEAPEATALMKARGVNPAAIKHAVASSAELALLPEPAAGSINLVPSSAFEHVAQRAILDAQASQDADVTPAHLLVALASRQEGTAVEILRQHGFDTGKA